MNLNCACGNGRRPVQNILNFYIKVNLKDETGYLVGCRLSGEVAEKTLSCTPDEFKVKFINKLSRKKLNDIANDFCSFITRQ